MIFLGSYVGLICTYILFFPEGMDQFQCYATYKYYALAMDDENSSKPR
jgi:hypothetical protein